MQQRGHSRDRFRCSAKVGRERVLAGPVQHLNRASSSLEVGSRVLLMIFEGQVTSSGKESKEMKPR
jgi:hypothetical protein